jgi:hypothetical protein
VGSVTLSTSGGSLRGPTVVPRWQSAEVSEMMCPRCEYHCAQIFPSFDAAGEMSVGDTLGASKADVG